MTQIMRRLLSTQNSVRLSCAVILVMVLSLSGVAEGVMYLSFSVLQLEALPPLLTHLHIRIIAPGVAPAVPLADVMGRVSPLRMVLVEICLVLVQVEPTTTKLK
ncbi:unnamed protein product [Amoebophrya sp. A25]|nr:unnamed protein product [Amoebophrya sp. A25]|eukprot:GSA25T00021342001.1